MARTNRTAYRGRRARGYRGFALGAAVVTSGLFLAWVAQAVFRPFFVASGMDSENVQIQREIMDLKVQNQHLEKEAVLLSSPQGMEREARRLGYVRRGETPLVIAR